jgi:hypothetical protein
VRRSQSLGDFENKFFDNIIKSQKLGDFYLVQYKQNENQIEKESETHNVSIGQRARSKAVGPGGRARWARTGAEVLTSLK